MRLRIFGDSKIDKPPVGIYSPNFESVSPKSAVAIFSRE